MQFRGKYRHFKTIYDLIVDRLQGDTGEPFLSTLMIEERICAWDIIGRGKIGQSFVSFLVGLGHGS